MKEKSNAPHLRIPVFAAATLAPAIIMALAAVWGGIWVWIGFVYMGFLALVIDQLIPRVAEDAKEGQEFPGSDRLLIAVGLCLILLFPTVVWAITNNDALSPIAKFLLLLSAGYWFGQVAHPAAHELIHRPNRLLFWLGTAVYTSLLMGHHSSAHRLVHHVYVATENDPNSAPAGVGFWRFAPQAWWGSFRAGWQAETKLRRGKSSFHPYILYLGGSGACLVLGAVIGGVFGVAVWLGLAVHASLQILLADYIQHYGLRREILPSGKPEPVRAWHSWNSPQWFSQALMLNAPRHSDHHIHPSRPYPNLRLPQEAPLLPWPLPLAAAIAMFPRLWKRKMKKRLSALNQQQIRVDPVRARELD